MFNLEEAIAEWRRQMLAAGIKTPVPLEELESHLREDVERQIQAGLDAREAFENSVRKIGPAGMLKHEFKKVCRANGQSWVWFANFGLVVTLMLNLVALFVFHKSSSVFFSDLWGSAWFPSYIVWISFTIIGGAAGFAKRRTQSKTTRPDRPS
jgi:hypothetical protein